MDNLRHSCSHLLAAAVVNLWPKVQPTIGPVIENGFYYDFDMGGAKLSEKDLPKIEKKMKELLPNWGVFEKIEMTAKEAEKIYKNNPYKQELIKDLQKEKQKITFYESGKFLDLCKGGHTDSPKSKLKYFKLLSVAGAYWRGSEKNKMLTRIYGTCFPTQKELDEYLNMLKEAKKRDHRKIGKELDLFTFSEDVGPGLPLWTPKGTIIQQELRDWAEETEKKWGYVRVRTPHIAKHTLYETSGHLPYYMEDMYPPMNVDGDDYYLKGMNCPHHHLIYKSSPKSYKDLPLRYAEYGEVYRFEQSGTLFGLMRVRFIQQNDAHIYCSEEDAEKEFLDVLKLHEYYYNTLGLTRDNYHVVVGLPDEKMRNKYHGDKKLWVKAEKMMTSAIKKSGIKSVDDIGGAAFYGPKVDFNVVSSVGREFGISTNQLDLYMPTRFNLTYTNKYGQEKLAVVIHRAPLGSHERFIGFLIEHFGGNFPTWLTPTQVKVLPITERNVDYAKQVVKSLTDNNIRVELDDRNETLQAKIRDAQLEKVAYMLIVGDKEEKTKGVSVRKRNGKDLGALKLDSFIKDIKKEIEEKKID
ncbi:threonine--tRNA ligase [Patescibacteria group bacterium]